MGLVRKLKKRMMMMMILGFLHGSREISPTSLHMYIEHQMAAVFSVPVDSFQVK